MAALVTSTLPISLFSEDMVNAQATKTAAKPSDDRRERERVAAPKPASLGLANANPFGDLHTLQYLSARLARALRPVIEPLYRCELRTWAEPLAVQRLSDYRAERGDALAAWLGLPTGHEAQPQLVVEGGLVMALLDLFFGGAGTTPTALPKEFSPAADALVVRLGKLIVPVLTATWEPVARLTFAVGAVEANPAVLAGIELDDALIVTRIGFARGDGTPSFLDIVYPVAALKPHTESIVRKVHTRTPDVAPAWRANLTRAVMNVRLPVRTVLAEPMLPLAKLLDLKVGDVIPIGIGDQIPVMVGNDRLGFGTVGTSAGKAAIQLNSLALLEGPRP